MNRLGASPGWVVELQHTTSSRPIPARCSRQGRSRPLDVGAPSGVIHWWSAVHEAGDLPVARVFGDMVTATDRAEVELVGIPPCSQL